VVGTLEVRHHVVPEHVHVEREGALRDFHADAAQADDAQRAALQSAGLAELLLVPLVGAQLGHVVRDPAIQVDHVPHDQLGDRDGVHAGAVGDLDAALLSGGDIDRVVAGAGADHDLELLAGLERVGVDLRRADDQHGGVELRDALGEGRVLEVRRTGDLGGDLLQLGDSESFELVGDEDFHWLVSRTGRWSLGGGRVSLHIATPAETGIVLDPQRSA